MKYLGVPYTGKCSKDAVFSFHLNFVPVSTTSLTIRSSAAIGHIETVNINAHAIYIDECRFFVALKIVSQSGKNVLINKNSCDWSCLYRGLPSRGCQKWDLSV